MPCEDFSWLLKIKFMRLDASPSEIFPRVARRCLLTFGGILRSVYQQGLRKAFSKLSWAGTMDLRVADRTARSLLLTVVLAAALFRRHWGDRKKVGMSSRMLEWGMEYVFWDIESSSRWYFSASEFADRISRKPRIPKQHNIDTDKLIVIAQAIVVYDVVSIAHLHGLDSWVDISAPRAKAACSSTSARLSAQRWPAGRARVAILYTSFCSGLIFALFSCDGGHARLSKPYAGHGVVVVNGLHGYSKKTEQCCLLCAAQLHNAHAHKYAVFGNMHCSCIDFLFGRSSLIIDYVWFNKVIYNCMHTYKIVSCLQSCKENMLWRVNRRKTSIILEIYSLQYHYYQHKQRESFTSHVKLSNLVYTRV